jgi:hypothetical protein
MYNLVHNRVYLVVSTFLDFHFIKTKIIWIYVLSTTIIQP